MAVPVRPEPDHPESSTPATHVRVRPRRRGPWRFLRELFIVVVLALLISAGLRAFVLQAFYVPSPSMVPTVQPGDRILALKPRLGPIARGEVVVFKDPGGWLDDPLPATGWQGPLTEALMFIGLLPSDSGNDLVKRVIGVAGDRVACCDAQGRIVVNGVALDEAYRTGPTDQVRFDVVVPPASVFVLGDNRSDSRDSRFFLDTQAGSVPTGNVVGRASAVVWPFDRMQVIDIPASFDAIPRG